MNRTSLVTFYWDGAPVALPSTNVTALVDAPAIGPLPVKFGQIEWAMAYGNDLYPLIDDPKLDVGRSSFVTVVVTDGEDGKLALRVDSDVKVESGELQGETFARLEGNRTALLLDRTEILHNATMESAA